MSNSEEIPGHCYLEWSTALRFFFLMWPFELFENIANNTNLYAQYQDANFFNHCLWKKTNLAKLCIWVGFIIQIKRYLHIGKKNTYKLPREQFFQKLDPLAFML